MTAIKTLTTEIIKFVLENLAQMTSTTNQSCKQTMLIQMLFFWMRPNKNEFSPLVL